MLRAVPDGWFSYDFTVFDRSETPVARANLANWRETAKLEVGGTRYEAHRKGWASKEFVVEREDGRVVAVAEKPSAWRERFVFEHHGNRYELKKESAWRSAFVLSRDGIGLVGSVRRKGFFNREWTVDVPEELPLEVRVFSSCGWPSSFGSERTPPPRRARRERGARNRGHGDPRYQGARQLDHLMFPGGPRSWRVGASALRS